MYSDVPRHVLVFEIGLITEIHAKSFLFAEERRRDVPVGVSLDLSTRSGTKYRSGNGMQVSQLI